MLQSRSATRSRMIQEHAPAQEHDEEMESPDSGEESPDSDGEQEDAPEQQRGEEMESTDSALLCRR